MVLLHSEHGSTICFALSRRRNVPVELLMSISEVAAYVLAYHYFANKVNDLWDSEPFIGIVHSLLCYLKIKCN